MPKEQLVLLAKQARNKSRQFDFMCKTVERWNKEDIRNAEAAQADLDRQTTKKAPTKQNFTQRKYTEEELTRFAKVFDDDTE